MRKSAVRWSIAALFMILAGIGSLYTSHSSEPAMEAGRGTVSFIKGQKELFILLLETGDDYKLIRKRFSDYKLA